MMSTWNSKGDGRLYPRHTDFSPSHSAALTYFCHAYHKNIWALQPPVRQRFRITDLSTPKPGHGADNWYFCKCLLNSPTATPVLKTEILPAIPSPPPHLPWQAVRNSDLFLTVPVCVKSRGASNFFIQHYWKWTTITEHFSGLQEDFLGRKVHKIILSSELKPNLAYLLSSYHPLFYSHDRDRFYDLLLWGSSSSSVSWTPFWALPDQPKINSARGEAMQYLQIPTWKKWGSRGTRKHKRGTALSQ